MKKLLLLLSIILVSCADGRKPAQHKTEETSDYGTFIVELTAKNKTHEYLLYRTGRDGNGGGMVHLPECRYCKHK